MLSPYSSAAEKRGLVFNPLALGFEIREPDWTVCWKCKFTMRYNAFVWLKFITLVAIYYMHYCISFQYCAIGRQWALLCNIMKNFGLFCNALQYFAIYYIECIALITKQCNGQTGQAGEHCQLTSWAGNGHLGDTQHRPPKYKAKIWGEKIFWYMPLSKYDERIKFNNQEEV